MGRSDITPLIREFVGLKFPEPGRAPPHTESWLCGLLALCDLVCDSPSTGMLLDHTSTRLHSGSLSFQNLGRSPTSVSLLHIHSPLALTPSMCAPPESFPGCTRAPHKTSPGALVTPYLDLHKVSAICCFWPCAPEAAVLPLAHCRPRAQSLMCLFTALLRRAREAACAHSSSRTGIQSQEVGVPGRHR